MNILITGGNGYIAKSIYLHLNLKYNITLINRNDVDLTDRNKVAEYFSDKYFDIVIHSAVSGGHRLISDTNDVVAYNLLMYDNIIRCRDKFNKFIHFTSGAEDDAKTPYGFSKRIISKLMKLDSRSINLKIYAVFDENELSTRFIKSNIKRYINRENLIVHQNKKMDFFYMKDLISIIEWLIDLNKDAFPISDINCSYDKKYSLFEISQIINSLGNYTVDIMIQNNIEENPYYGDATSLPIKMVGLVYGICETYKKMLNE
jgi:nucleoside-diphosphate-sugar epimerase